MKENKGDSEYVNEKNKDAMTLLEKADQKTAEIEAQLQKIKKSWFDAL